MNPGVGVTPEAGARGETASPAATGATTTILACRCQLRSRRTSRPRSAAAGRLQLVLEGFDDPDDDYFDDEPIVPLRSYPLAPADRPRPPRESWKDQLDDLRRQLQPEGFASPQQAWSGERRLLYVIDAP